MGVSSTKSAGTTTVGGCTAGRQPTGTRPPPGWQCPYATAGPTPAEDARVARDQVAIVHDYLTQRGGAERVVLAMARAFPRAPIYTSLYEPESTFGEFAHHEVRVTGLNRVGLLRRRHRLALPLLAPSFSRLVVDADVGLCSTSGWSHGAGVTGRKVVYWHAPARWLYQTDRYLGRREIGSPSPDLQRVGLRVLSPALRSWDRRAARSGDRSLVNSSATLDRVRALYGITAEVLPPPPALLAGGPSRPIPGIEAGFWLCVARLLPYKNVDAVIEAIAARPGDRLIVVGTGPEQERLRGLASPAVTFAGQIEDDQMRWCYENCRALVSASYEDFGLTPLEAASFGRPSAVLDFGGHRDTVIPDRTGILFRRPEPRAVAEALGRIAERKWDETVLREHVERFSESRFAARLQSVVAEELEVAGTDR